MQNYLLDDQLVFSAAERSGGSSRIRLIVVSDCASESTAFSEYITTSALRTHYALGEFLSPDVLTLLKAQDHKPLTCSFEFVAKSTIGDTHSFTLVSRPLAMKPVALPSIMTIYESPALLAQDLRHGIALASYSIRNTSAETLSFGVDNLSQPVELLVTLFNHTHRIIASPFPAALRMAVIGAEMSTVQNQTRFTLAPQQAVRIDFTMVLKRLKCRDYRILGAYYSWFEDQPLRLKILRSVTDAPGAANELTTFQLAPSSVKYFYSTPINAAELQPPTPTSPPTIEQTHEDLCRLVRR